MMVPGLSTERKLIIQNKLDKILNKEYYSPCKKYIKQINKFNEQITKNFQHEKMSKLNAKLSKNLYLKRNPQNKLKLLINIDTNVSEYEHVKKIIYKTFTINELLILYNNLDYFIKNEKIRAIFPKLKNNICKIYSKEITEKTPMIKIKKKLNLVSPLQFNKDLNKANSSYFINKDKINKILSEYNKKVKSEEKNIINKELKDIKQQNFFQKTMRKLKYNINNISNVSNSKEYSFEHPLVNYYICQKKNNKISNIINYKNNVLLNKKNKNKYKNLINKNKSALSLIKNIEGNLLTKRIKEKNETHKRLRDMISLTKRINTNFKRTLFNLRKNGSCYDINLDKNSNNLLNLDSGIDFNSVKLI